MSVNILRLVFVFTTLILFNTAVAQSRQEKKVSNVVEKFIQLMIDPRKDELERVVANDLSYGHSTGKIQDKEAFINELLHGSFDFLSAKTIGQSIKITGHNAIVRHVLVVEATNEGKPVTIRIGNLLVWKRQSGKWKLLVRQGFKF